jgi:hypothetical protein
MYRAVASRGASFFFMTFFSCPVKHHEIDEIPGISFLKQSRDMMTTRAW